MHSIFWLIGWFVYCTCSNLVIYNVAIYNGFLVFIFLTYLFYVTKLFSLLTLFFFATTPIWQLWFQTHLQKLKENEQSSNSSSVLIRTLPYPPVGEEHLDVHRRSQLKFLRHWLFETLYSKIHQFWKEMKNTKYKQELPNCN